MPARYTLNSQPTPATTTTTEMLVADLSNYEPLTPSSRDAAERARLLVAGLNRLALTETPGGADLHQHGGMEAEDGRSRRSANMTECVTVPSSEHVAEIVGRQGKNNFFNKKSRCFRLQSSEKVQTGEYFFLNFIFMTLRYGYSKKLKH